MFEDEAYRYVDYHVDLNQNPSAWPGPDRPSANVVDIDKVEVLYINTAGSESSFRMLRTGTNQNHQRVLLQVAKHVARGLYNVVNMSISTYSCVVVLKTSMSQSEMEKGGFPWDPAEGELPDVVLK